MSNQTLSKKILVVDDDVSTCEMIASSLELEGYSVKRALTSAEAEASLSATRYDLVISDIYIDALTGLDLLRKLERPSPGTRLILMTAHATVETAVEAVRAGAFDYLSKPFELEDLFGLVRRALAPEGRERSEKTDAGRAATLSSMIIGRSAAMAELYRRIARVSATDANVWISGESGTGKELAASAIHRHSRRAERPFVAVNCGALAEMLLESELFGHVRGAFTGASGDRRGLFESAAGGTLFLDEITETSPSFQIKLLRLLQEGEYRPVGSSTPRRADVRILAASNLDAQAAIVGRSFREDLYYRLAAFTLELPPLRERAEDIPLLAEHFLADLSRQRGRGVRVTGDALEALGRFDWPGNVRQLRNALEKLSILSPDGTIRAEDVDRWLEEARKERGATAAPASLEDVEKQRIREVLLQCGGNKTRAAAILGIDRSTLYRKMEAFGISGESIEGGPAEAGARS